MLGNENWDEKLTLLGSSGEESKLIIPDLPEIDRLTEAHYSGYKQILLGKVLDYDGIAIHPYLQEGYSRGVSRAFGNPLNQSQQLDFSRLSDADLATIKAYKKGVSLLKLGLQKDGKNEIKKALDGGLPHAKYVYAIISFKEVVQYHTSGKSRLPTKKVINEAVQYMLHEKQDFFPLPSFVLGIMQSYYQIFVNKEVSDQVTFARKCFEHVLRGFGYSDGNYSLIVPRKYIVMEGESKEYFMWIVQSAKYELARSMLLYPEGLSGAKSLLQQLSTDGFVDAKCLYALALLKNAFGDVQYLKKLNFDQAYDLLEQSITHGHKEAMFFFGTLPFRQEFKLLDEQSQSRKGSYCFGYLGKYLEACGSDGKFKKDAEILIAAEYVKEKGSYAMYDEVMAKYILKENDCTYELQDLEKKIKERQERSKNVLPYVLGALEKVHNELKKNIEPSTQQLSSKVKELLDALQRSGLIVKQSPLLPTTLEQLHISSTMDERFLLSPLYQLCYVLESQVYSQSHCSSQKEVLPPLQSLLLTCIELQMEHVRIVSSIPSQYFNPNVTSTTLQMEHSCKVSRIPSEAGQDSTLLCSTKNTRKGGSFSSFESDCSSINMPTPKSELSVPSVRRHSVPKELERRGDISDSDVHSTCLERKQERKKCERGAVGNESSG